ncbi:MAG: LysM peptidoglycan-binding domain-containing protein [bacterium]
MDRGKRTVGSSAPVRSAPVRLGVLILGDAVVLWTLRPSQAGVEALIRQVRQPYAWIDADGADTAVAELLEPLLWLVAAWLAVGLIAAAAAALPGRAGVLSAGLARTTLPRGLKRALAGSLGMSLVLTPLASSARPPGADPATRSSATATVRAPLPATPTVAVALPNTGTVAAARPTSPAPDLPPPTQPQTGAPTRSATVLRSASSPPVPLPTTPAPSLPARDVVVRPGDSLWAIAAARIGSAAGPRDIAAAWPAWYRANRAAIGADPDRLYPGQRLRAPDGATTPAGFATPATSLPAPELPEKGSS